MIAAILILSINLLLSVFAAAKSYGQFERLWRDKRPSRNVELMGYVRTQRSLFTAHVLQYARKHPSEQRKIFSDIAMLITSNPDELSNYGSQLAMYEVKYGSVKIAKRIIKSLPMTYDDTLVDTLIQVDITNSNQADEYLTHVYYQFLQNANDQVVLVRKALHVKFYDLIDEIGEGVILDQDVLDDQKLNGALSEFLYQRRENFKDFILLNYRHFTFPIGKNEVNAANDPFTYQLIAFDFEKYKDLLSGDFTENIFPILPRLLEFYYQLAQLQQVGNVDTKWIINELFANYAAGRPIDPKMKIDLSFLDYLISLKLDTQETSIFLQSFASDQVNMKKDKKWAVMRPLMDLPSRTLKLLMNNPFPNWQRLTQLSNIMGVDYVKFTFARFLKEQKMNLFMKEVVANDKSYFDLVLSEFASLVGSVKLCQDAPLDKFQKRNSVKELRAVYLEEILRGCELLALVQDDRLKICIETVRVERSKVLEENADPDIQKKDVQNFITLNLNRASVGHESITEFLKTGSYDAAMIELAINYLDADEYENSLTLLKLCRISAKSYTTDEHMQPHFKLFMKRNIHNGDDGHDRIVAFLGRGPFFELTKRLAIDLLDERDIESVLILFSLIADEKNRKNVVNKVYLNICSTGNVESFVIIKESKDQLPLLYDNACMRKAASNNHLKLLQKLFEPYKTRAAVKKRFKLKYMKLAIIDAFWKGHTQVVTLLRKKGYRRLGFTWFRQVLRRFFDRESK